MNKGGLTLRELITERRGTRTYSRLSLDCGGYPTTNRLQQLGTKEVQLIPEPKTIRGLSVGLGVSELEVVKAAMRSCGLNALTEDPENLTIAGAGKLPVEAQETVFQLVQTLMRMHVAPQAKAS